MLTEHQSSLIPLNLLMCPPGATTACHMICMHFNTIESYSKCEPTGEDLFGLDC